MIIILQINRGKKVAEYKRFKIIKHKNVTIGGLYEHHLVPWDIMMLIGFKVKLTDEAEKEFKDVHELRSLMANHVLGKQSMLSEIRQVLLPGWHTTVSVYSCDHTPMQIDFGRPAEFQIEIHFDAPQSYTETKDYKGLEKEFQMLAKRVADIKNFKSNKFYEISPSVSVK